MAEAKIGGYPKRSNGIWVLTDFKGRSLGQGFQRNCRRLKPGQPGAWIDSQKCSYNFKVDGRWYSCRGYGEGIAVNCRIMKNPPSDSRARRF